MRDNLKALGLRLRAARLDADLGQLEIARRLNVSKQLVSHWELGRSEITIFDLQKLSQIVGADVQYLLTGLSGTPGGNARLHMPQGRLIPKLSAEEVAAYAKGKLDPQTVAARHATATAVGPRAIALQPPDRGIYSDPSNITVTIDPDKPLSPGDIGLWVLGSGEMLLGRYRPGPGSKPPAPPFVLRFDNEDFLPREIAKSDRPVCLGAKVEHAVIGSR